MKRGPAAFMLLDEIREKEVELSALTLARPMEEAEEDRRFAREHNNSMAAMKSTELQAKLAGHLVERVEVAEMDLRETMAQA